MANQIVQQITTELENLQQELGQFQSTAQYLNGAKQNVENAVKAVNTAESNFEKRIVELKETYQSIIKLKEAIGSTIAKIDTINFPERLESIENTVKQTIATLNNIRQETLDELKKASETIQDADFDGKFNSLKEVVNLTVKSSDTLTQYISKLKLGEKFEKFDKSVEKHLENNFNKIELNTNRISTHAVNSIKDLNLPIRMDKLDANIAGIMAGIQNTQSRIDTLERNLAEKIKETGEKQSQALQNITNLDRDLKNLFKKQHTNTWITWVLMAIGGLILAYLAMNY